MHWGHAVSRDLVTWEHRDLALYPTMREDRNGCFSGSAVEKDGKLYLIYTGVRYEVVNPEDPHTCLDDQFESAQLMISSEDGFHFDNENGKKVIIPPITDPAIGDRTHTRDPKVWKSGDHWYLVLGSTVGEKYGEVLFYRSDDLHTWTYVDKAFKGPEYGWMWECPDYFETKGGKVLILSAMGFLKNGEKEKNQSICFHVEFDQSSCRIEIPDVYQFLDCGLDLYAPQTTLDAEGRRILSAWVRMPKVTDEGWIGMFCTPRVVEVRDGHIFFPMHPNQRAKDGYLVSLDLEDGEELDVGGFVIRREGDRIRTDRSAVFPDFPGAHIHSETPALKGGSFHLDVVVDKNLVEVFVGDGEYVISNAVYGLEDQIRYSGEGKERKLRIYAAQD